MNVLVIMCDHHRYDALGCLGNPLAHTPNLDRLAAESVRFDQCFTQSPVCAPARHSLATGQYAHRHGVINNGYKPFRDMHTIAHSVAPLGYRRYCLGHMHWTDLDVDHGYERYVTQAEWAETMPAKAMGIHEAESNFYIRRTTGGPSPKTAGQHWGCHVAANSIRLMKEAVAKGERFLCWTAFTEPHPPFYPPKEFYELVDQSLIELPDRLPEDANHHPQVNHKRREWDHLSDVERRQIIAGYYGMVALVDSYIGMVLEAVEQMGIADDTAIIWTSDHGDQMWENELFLKFIMREGATHVPLLIKAPGIQPGTCHELAEHIDIFPTICEFTGAERPDSVHGRSLLPLLEGQAPEDWRDAVFSQIGNVQMIRTREWELNVYDGQPGELFNLVNDRAETRNLIGRPEHSDTVAHLFRRVRDWEAAHAHPDSPALRPSR